MVLVANPVLMLPGRGFGATAAAMAEDCSILAVVKGCYSRRARSRTLFFEWRGAKRCKYFATPWAMQVLETQMITRVVVEDVVGFAQR